MKKTIGNIRNEKSPLKKLSYYLKLEKTGILAKTVLRKIALIYDELNEYDKAATYYEKALSLDENNPFCYYGLAIIYDNLGEYDKAVSYYKEAIRLYPEYTEAHFFLADVYDKTGEQGLAIYYYKKTIESNPDYFYAYLNLGSIYESMGKDNEALSLFKTAEIIDDTNHLLYFNFGVVYHKLGRIDLSIECYRKSLSLYSFYPYAYLNLAIIYKDKKNDLKKAIEIYSKGIDNNPCSAVLYYNRACCFALIKDNMNAAKDLKVALSLDESLYEYMMEDEELKSIEKTVFFA